MSIMQFHKALVELIVGLTLDKTGLAGKTSRQRVIIETQITKIIISIQ